tara:strand:+ start:868 stop:1389 length:522 start_codon:yes stop_codon:yes gene_type:complete
MLDSKVFKNGYAVSGSILAQGEKNDCAVRAVANAFDIGYNVAHKWCADTFNRKPRKGTKLMNSTLKGITDVEFPIENGAQLDLFNELTSNQFTIKHIGDCPKRGGKLINRKYKHKPVAYTVKAFMQKFTKGTFIVLVEKHALCIKNGVLIDNGDKRFNGYRRVVESAFQISEK